jgi:hypothetical protein
MSGKFMPKSTFLIQGNKILKFSSKNETFLKICKQNVRMATKKWTLKTKKILYQKILFSVYEMCSGFQT